MNEELATMPSDTTCSTEAIYQQRLRSIPGPTPSCGIAWCRSDKQFF